jgi:hypothetical protein
MAVRLYDPLELALPDVGLVTIEDAESGEQVLVDTQEPGFRERFEALAAKHEADLRLSLAQAGVDTLELATDDDLLTSLLRCVALRRQRLRNPSPRSLPANLKPPPEQPSAASPWRGRPQRPGEASAAASAWQRPSVGETS